MILIKAEKDVCQEIQSDQEDFKLNIEGEREKIITYVIKIVN